VSSNRSQQRDFIRLGSKPVLPQPAKKAPDGAGLEADLRPVEQVQSLCIGGAERATSQTAYVLQGQANQALATQYITLNVETAFSCVHDSN
jgi:hypothetical protein